MITRENIKTLLSTMVILVFAALPAAVCGTEAASDKIEGAQGVPLPSDPSMLPPATNSISFALFTAMLVIAAIAGLGLFILKNRGGKQNDAERN